MLTSDKPDSVWVTIEPPPPEPPTCLNRPPGYIVKVLGDVNKPLPLIISNSYLISSCF